jgi:hypothetical protein
LTICTYWLVPTSPFVSGGRQTQSLACPHGLLKGRHAPSKFWIGAEIGPLPFFDCTTGSLTLLVRDCGTSDSLSRPTTAVTGATGSTGRLLTSGETPSNTPLRTTGPLDPVRVLVLLELACRLVEPARATPG